MTSVVREILPQVGRPTVALRPRRGRGPARTYRSSATAGTTRFQALRAGQPPLPVALNLPGLHNVRNALAAIAVATELEVEDAAIQRGAGRLPGHRPPAARSWAKSRRRPGASRCVDDYGHHPTEIEATIEAARQAWPERRLVLAFQPHRYTRTRDLIDDFGRVAVCRAMHCS